MPLISLVLLWWSFGHSRTISPDGMFYRRLAVGEAVPRPYALRWAVPTLLGPDLENWALGRWAATLLLSFLSWHWAYTQQVDPGAFTALVLGLSIVRTSWLFPVLVDLWGLALMLAIGLSGDSPPWAQVGAGLIGALVHERAPLMGAVLAQSPWPLAGYVVTAVRWRLAQPVPETAPLWLRHPFQEARKEGRFSLETLVWPWGVGLAALAAPWGPWELAFVALAYAPLLVAQDHARIYQWAFPVVLGKALTVIPGPWLGVALLLHLFNPWRKVL